MIRTDKSGNFQIKTDKYIREGITKFVIKFMKDGYETKREPIYFPQGGNANFIFSLVKKKERSLKKWIREHKSLLSISLIPVGLGLGLNAIVNSEQIQINNDNNLYILNRFEKDLFYGESNRTEFFNSLEDRNSKNNTKRITALSLLAAGGAGLIWAVISPNIFKLEIKSRKPDKLTYSKPTPILKFEFGSNIRLYYNF